MKSSPLLAVLMGATVVAAASRPNFLQSKPSPYFDYQVVNFSARDSSMSRLLVFLHVLYDELQFAEDASGYQATYEVTIVAANDSNGIREKQEMVEKVRVDEFEETNSGANYLTHAFEFVLPPGHYNLTLSLHDQVSDSLTKVELGKTLRDFSGRRSQLEISDILLVDHAELDESKTARIMPGIYENTCGPGEDLFLILGLHSFSDQSPVHIRQRIRDRQGRTVLDQKRVWPRRKTQERLVLPIWTDSLPYGLYTVEMTVSNGTTVRTASSPFRIAWNGIPESAMHLDQALAVTLDLAEEGEREALETALRAVFAREKRDALLAFWERRDPTPETPANELMTTFYVRVQIADEHFGGEQEGWKTDRGRVFVRYGPPDEVKLYTKAVTSRPYQIWYYRTSNQQFLFVDHQGLGDYRLAGRPGT